MSGATPPSPEEIDALAAKLAREALESGYRLNPDASFTRDLVEGLLINEQRYGYWNCPCRRATGDRAKDLDIICPCDYRDADLDEFGSCFCALYVSEEVARGEKKVRSIPERRPADRDAQEKPGGKSATVPGPLPLPVWRCKVCGYLCGRESPPEKCPICKASKERFERFM